MSGQLISLKHAKVGSCLPVKAKPQDLKVRREMHILLLSWCLSSGVFNDMQLSTTKRMRVILRKKKNQTCLF